MESCDSCGRDVDERAMTNVEGKIDGKDKVYFVCKACEGSYDEEELLEKCHENEKDPHKGTSCDSCGKKVDERSMADVKGFIEGKNKAYSVCRACEGSYDKKELLQKCHEKELSLKKAFIIKNLCILSSELKKEDSRIASALDHITNQMILAFNPVTNENLKQIMKKVVDIVEDINKSKIQKKNPVEQLEKIQDDLVAIEALCKSFLGKNVIEK